MLLIKIPIQYTWNQEEGADGHGKDKEAIEDRRDAMSGSLFSSEVVGRALVFLLSQPSITISNSNLYRPLVIYQNNYHCLSYLGPDTVGTIRPCLVRC